jgi:uncharacterized OB-fold protein
MLPCCPRCGPFFYPRILCPRCHRRDVTWIEASGRGTLYTFAIAYQAFHPEFRLPPPYVLALIELAEGPRLLSNLINVEPDAAAVQCGMPVEIVFERLTDEVTLPLFQPVPPVPTGTPPGSEPSRGRPA